MSRVGQEAHLREQRVDLRPQAAQHQRDAVARAELVELAEGQGHRGIEPLDHPEVEEQVPHALAEDQLATRLHQARGEGEEQVALQAQGPGGGPRPLQLGHLLQGALLVGTMGAAGQVVADVVGPAVAVGEEDRRHQQAGDHAGDDVPHGDQHQDAHDQRVLVQGKLEEGVPEPLAEQGEAQIQEEAGQHRAGHVGEGRGEDEGDARAQDRRPHAGHARRRPPPGRSAGSG